MKNTVNEIAPGWRRPLIRALERRYGASMLPYKITNDCAEMPFDRWRCEDVENGAFIVGRITPGSKKLRVVAEGGPTR
jgi:hypothetical protein